MRVGLAVASEQRRIEDRHQSEAHHLRDEPIPFGSCILAQEARRRGQRLGAMRLNFSRNWTPARSPVTAANKLA
jgi:hypothetical protein